jgi:hypothetical protein
MAWRFPIQFGGPDRTHDIEHQALLDAMRLAFDTAEDTEFWIETRVDAWAVAMIWSINRRIANQNVPTRMYENLPKWEEACGLRPAVDDLDVDRRARLAAKLRGLGSNTLEGMADAAEKALGINFEAFDIVDPDDWITYWPGLNPGPPGYEFSSNRATVGIQMNRIQLSEAEFRKKRNWVIEIMNQLVPCWETFVVGTDDEFLCGVGIVGQTVLA